MIEAGLYSHLTAASPTIVGTRVYPVVIPEHARGDATKLPCVVYNRVNVQRQQKFCGTDGLVRSTFQLDCYATTYLEAKQVAAAVRGVMVDYRGTWSSVQVKAVFLDLEFDGLDAEPGLYRVVQRYTVWHEENP